MLARLGATLFSFRGRIPRSTFWWTMLLLGSGLMLVRVALEAGFGPRGSLVLFPFLVWAALAHAARRLRDRGRRPAWLVLVLVPVIGPLWALIELGLRRGIPGENRYG